MDSYFLNYECGSRSCGKGIVENVGSTLMQANFYLNKYIPLE